MAIRVQSENFDIGAEIENLRAGRTDVGAIVSFTGTVRDLGGDEAIADMTLEHYPGMTEKALKVLEADARTRWPLQDSLVVHRYGTLRPGENIVLVVTLSQHRQAAFEAAAFMMDDLKTRAPFWKKETTSEGTRWVAARASDDDAAARWHAASSERATAK